MLTIYGRKSSFNLQKVMWLVGELGIAHKHIELGGSFGGLDTPEFLAMNPHGRVPVIDDSGIIVWESHAILRYLAAKYGSETPFWPTNPAERAKADQWMDWSQTSLQPAFLVGVFWGWYRTPEAQRNLAAVDKALEQTGRCLKHIDRQLNGKSFMLGEHLSLADIPIGTHLYRYLNLDLPRPNLPNVERWYERLQSSPAYREHVCRPFDELYGRLDF
ncbi:glutathione S-transferase family protein [Bradyrhizobium sp. BR 10289]|uniref:glutathione S-transferase family protein n=1 Tax=Bradyrhizobium sp. BR 10289 TaxID=2749993 RepID=UPI001C654743|nr:glutathione S-transferase family protein [Bradyrhizobium sp. BR 10289]MBW7967797.1 glutathione S-transferase family protein [Bradyrhizobium sp. BR 10289]